MAQALRQGVLPAAASRYRRVLTWASAVSFVSILVIFWVWFPKDESRLLGVLLLLPVLLPYAFIPLRVYRQRLRSGLILAMVMGCAVFVPGICLIWFAFRWDRGWWLLCSLILMTILQPVLVVTALACYLPMFRQQPFRLKLLAAPLYGLLLIIVFSQHYSPVPSYISENESSAMYYLSAAVYAAYNDAFDTLHRGLYAEGLARFGPDSNPRCRVVVIPGQLPIGYLVDYRGTEPAVTVEGCTRFKGFTITARPAEFGKTGILSFFVDESRRIHFTSENRPARANDPEGSPFSMYPKWHRP